MSDAALIVGRAAGLGGYALAQLAGPEGGEFRAEGGEFGPPPGAPPPESWGGPGEPPHDGGPGGPRMAGPGGPGFGGPGFGGTPWFAHQAGPGGRPPRDRFHEFEREEIGVARTEWQGLSPEERRVADERHGERERMLHVRLEPRLARRQAQFVRQGGEQVALNEDGSKTVTTAFRFAGPDGEREVRVGRMYDAQGILVQIVESLTGTSDGVALDCERVRTFKPDGTVEHASDLQLTIDDQVHNVHWAKRTSADGGLAGTGSIVRPDGGVVALTSTATAESLETITGQDPTGLTVRLEADATSGTARATLDAGADGSASIQIGVDVEAGATP